MDDKVGTRPESVVKRRGMLERGSCDEACWGMRELLRGGETKEAIGAASFLGDCWERKRSSSMAEDGRGAAREGGQGSYTPNWHRGLRFCSCRHGPRARGVSKRRRGRRRRR